MDSEVERRSCRVLLLRFHPEAFHETTVYEPMTVLVTGDRNWTDKEMIENVLCMWLTPKDTLLHGAATGADTMAASVAASLHTSVIPFPADWKNYGKAAGPIRNRQMLDQKPDLVLAFHDNLEESKGTRDCCLQARKRKIPVFVHHHVGTDLKWNYYTLP